MIGRKDLFGGLVTCCFIGVVAAADPTSRYQGLSNPELARPMNERGQRWECKLESLTGCRETCNSVVSKPPWFRINFGKKTVEYCVEPSVDGQTEDCLMFPLKSRLIEGATAFDNMDVEGDPIGLRVLNDGTTLYYTQVSNFFAAAGKGSCVSSPPKKAAPKKE